MAKHAYLVSPAAAVIAAVMGAALTVWPPTSESGKRLWVVSFALVGVLAIAGTILDRMALWSAEAQRDKNQDAKHAEVLMRLERRDAEKLAATRKRARFLADAIQQFLIDRNVGKPTHDYYGLPDQEFYIKIESFLPKWSEYYHQTKELYNERFATEALEIAHEFARSGVVDERLLSYAQHIDPPLVEQFAIRLRELGGQRD